MIFQIDRSINYLNFARLWILILARDQKLTVFMEAKAEAAVRPTSAVQRSIPRSLGLLEL